MAPNSALPCTRCYRHDPERPTSFLGADVAIRGLLSPHNLAITGFLEWWVRTVTSLFALVYRLTSLKKISSRRTCPPQNLQGAGMFNPSQLSDRTDHLSLLSLPLRCDSRNSPLTVRGTRIVFLEWYASRTHETLALPTSARHYSTLFFSHRSTYVANSCVGKGLFADEQLVEGQPIF